MRKAGSCGRARTLSVVMLLLCGGVAMGNERVLTGDNYSKLQQLCHDFHSVMPPPPPVEAVLIGTLDYTTGRFVWGPKVYEKKTEPDDMVVDLSQPWKDLKIRAIKPDLDPKISTLASAWGSGPPVLNMIHQAIHINVPPPTGAVASGATSGGAPSPKGKAAPKTAGSGREISPAVGVPNVLVPLAGHSTGYRKLYAPVRSGCVAMVFKVTNRPADALISVTSEGRTASAAADQIDLVIPARVGVPFSLTCAGKSFDDVIILDRPPVLGCFTLEALPLAIIYEPPGSNSSQKLITTKSIGTTLETFTSRASSETEPVRTDFSTVTEAIDLLGTVGKGVEKAYPQAGAAIKGAQEVLSAAWGSSETDKEVSNEVTDSRKLSMQVTTEDWGSTSTHQGPGKGDVFHYLIKPTFLWFAVSDQTTNSVYITVSLLGYKGVGRMSAHQLRTGSNPIPPKDMQLAMLKLDPMAEEYDAGAMGGVIVPDALKKGKIPGVPVAISRRRLVFTAFYSFGGSNSGMSIERTIEEEDTHTREKTETVTTTESAGFLSYVATNVPQDGDKQMTTVQGTSHGARAGSSVKIEVQYGTGENVDEFHNLNVYYDTLFGTFAFEEAEVSEDQQVSGQAMTADGQPASRQPISLTGPDGISTIGMTDEKGNFRLGSPALKKGRYTLKVGDKEVPLEFPGTAVRDLKVDTSAGTTQMSSTGQAAASGRKTKAGADPWEAAAGSASQPTAKEATGTDRAIRGKPGRPFTMEPNPELKGRLGRIIVAFPKDALCKDTHISIVRRGETKSAGSFYGACQADLLPGAYDVTVGGKVISDVTVTSKNDSTITTGVLRVHAGKETYVGVLDSDKKTKIANSYGDHDFGLPVGTYHVEVAGQIEPVEVKSNEVTEF